MTFLRDSWGKIRRGGTRKEIGLKYLLAEEEERWIKWLGYLRRKDRTRILRRALELKFIGNKSVGHSR